MNRLGPVVDASVALKWVVQEEHSTQSRRLLVDFADALLFAPSLLPAEVTNALHQRCRQGRMSDVEADTALKQFLDAGVRLLSPDALYPETLTLARALGLRATYDGLYVALARQLSTELWTADERLLSATSTLAPWVRWIGNYSSP